MPMERIAPEVLAASLEIALSSSPPSVVAALADNDRQRRERATQLVAAYLAKSLECADQNNWREPAGMQELFADTFR